MSHESHIVVLPPAAPVQELLPPPPAVDRLEAPPTPTPEEARAVEAVFAQQQKESNTVAGLVGMYTSAVMLHNLAVDTFGAHREEQKKMPKLKGEEEAQEESEDE
jgi:hypothetical protein